MPNNRFPVTIGDQTYSPEFQSAPEYAEGWQSVLGRAHEAEANPLCRCTSAGVQLAIRHVGPRYFLVRMPDTGHRHRAECPFYCDKPAYSGARCYPAGHIRETVAGILVESACLGTHLSGEGRASDGLSTTGLLHLLWQQASLNTWVNGWGRSREYLAWRIAEAAQRVAIGRAPLAANLRLVLSKKSGANPLAKQQDRFLVMGFLDKPSVRSLTNEPIMLNFDAGLELDQAIFIGKGVWAAAAKRFPWAVDAWRQRQTTVVLACLTRVEGKDYYRALDIALLPLGQRYIPVFSAADLKLLDHLLINERSFSKPLPFDAPASTVIPSFILNDCHALDEPIFVGYEDAAAPRLQQYLRATFHRQTGWVWKSPDQEIPNLPAKNPR